MKSLNYQNLKKPQTIFGGHFDIDRKNQRLSEISELEALEGFWQDSDNAAKIQKEKSLLEEVVFSYQSVQDLMDELDILVEYADDGDEESTQEAVEVFDKLKSVLFIP